MIKLQDFLKFAVEKNASDVHLSSGLRPMIRVDGDLQAITHEVLERTALHEAVQLLMSIEQRQKFAQEWQIDFSFSMESLARFRVNCFHQFRGVSVVFRIIPDTVFSLTRLDCQDIFKKICSFPHGLVLITGPTGSGKSSTMAAMVDYINSNFNKHIITIENPIEFIHQSKKCLIHQREIGEHTHDFPQALRSVLREDPDIILVGEMRDLESIRLAITAAETGHLVISTLHTNSVQETIDRLINVFPAEEQSFIRGMLSLSLQAVVAQTLSKKKEGGRVAICEIMLANTAIRNLIRENKIHQIFSVIQTSYAEGMVTRDRYIKQLISSGVTFA